MSTTNREPEVFVLYWDIPSPVFSDDFFGFDLSLAQLLNKVLGQTFSPQPRVDHLLFTLIRRELIGPEFDLGFHNFEDASFSIASKLTIALGTNLRTSTYSGTFEP